MRRINIQQLRWLGHAVRIEEDAPTGQIFDVGICGSQRREGPCLLWKDRGEPVIDCVKAGRNPLMGLLMVNYIRKNVDIHGKH